MVMHLKTSLRRRFILTLIGVVTLISLIFSVLVLGYTYSKKEAELQKQLGLTLKLAETVLPEVVWRGNERSIQDILRAILASDAVVYARILAGEHIAISQTKPAYKDTSFAEFQQSSGFLISGADVLKQGALIGKLQVVMSRDEIYGEILSTAFSVIGLFILLVFAILFTSLLILRLAVFRPLAKLERSANLIAAGNLDTSIDIDSNDEIGNLASAFRIMANRLEESFLNLEHKVIERTVDLSQAKIAAEETSRNLQVAGVELQALLDNSPVGILFADNGQVIKRANLEMEKITGYRSAELVGQTTAFLLTGSMGEGALSERFFPQLKKDGTCEKRAVLMRKDSSEVTCWLRGRSVPGSNELEGIIWSVEDITNRIYMEQELLKAKKQESIGVLAEGIAHDFNNILLAVIGNLSMAERMAGQNDLLREHVLAAQKASLRAKELTAKLLTFASGGDPVKSPASLLDLVKNSAKLETSGSNVNFVFKAPDSLWQVSMDKEQISQVIQDLVRNAEQSMPGGGTIQISFANQTIAEDEVVGLYPGRYVRVSLTDSGLGIEGRNIDRIFDPYFSTKEKDSSKGSGLGLAIVHSIVSRHDGKITVDSTPGKGTTFTLYLPARPVDGDGQSDRSAIIPSGRGVVLLPGSCRENQNQLSEMLLHMGYRAEIVSSDLDALDLYGEFLKTGNKIYAVILDLDDPGELGWQELLAQLLEMDPQARVIAASDSPESHMNEGFREYGFSALTIKPYRLLEVNRAMSRLGQYNRAGCLLDLQHQG